MRLTWLLAAIPAILSAQDPRDIMRRAVALDRKNLEISRNYTFLERQEVRTLDGSGKVKSKEIRTSDVTLLDGSPYRRLVAHNDQPLSHEEQKEEEKKLKNSNEQRRKESEEQRRKRIADWERKREKQREPLREVPDAFHFRLVSEEALNGGQAWVIDATPKPGYKPKLSSASFLSRVKARFWIDQADYQWIKVEMETLDTISYGGILVRLARGSRLVIEQTRVNNEVWLLKHISLQAAARILLVKSYRRDFDFTYSDYKKFQVDSHVIGAGQ